MVITSRLQSFLPKIISDIRCAFVEGRLITGNILTAYEVFHSMRFDTGASGTIAIKLDMAKAMIE